jgi:hypothetical protein
MTASKMETELIHCEHCNALFSDEAYFDEHVLECEKRRTAFHKERAKWERKEDKAEKKSQEKEWKKREKEQKRLQKQEHGKRTSKERFLG